MGTITVHVDDILFTGSPKFLRETEEILRTFRAGETEILLFLNRAIIFLGVKMELMADHSILLSQTHYIAEMPKMEASDYVNEQGELKNVQNYKTAAKQVLGSLIWIHQTRPDIGFNIAKIATDAAKSCTSGDLAWKLIVLYNKTLRYLKSYGRKIRYVPTCLKSDTFDYRWSQFMKLMLIAFPDAGFASLGSSHSIEGTFVILAQVLSRDGVINCLGHMLDHRCAKIHRVRRSSLDAEAHADVSACDQALWLKMLLTEITTGEYDIRKYSHPTEFPLRNPFAKDPTDDQVAQDLKWESALSKQKNAIAAYNVSEVEQYLQIHEMTDFSKLTCGANVESESKQLFLTILLTDSCSLYTAILRIQPRSGDKCA